MSIQVDFESMKLMYHRERAMTNSIIRTPTYYTAINTCRDETPERPSLGLSKPFFFTVGLSLPCPCSGDSRMAL